MKEQLLKYWKMLVSVGVGCAIFGWWYQEYPAHIIYQEMFQMFLYDGDYAWERIMVPGGMACYLSDFLSQFCYNPKLGALFVAVLCVGIQRLLWRCMKQQGVSSFYYPLSFLPLLPVLHFMGDENALFSFPISLVMTLGVMWGYGLTYSLRFRWIYVCMMLPLLYGMAGAVHFIFVVWLVTNELHRAAAERKYAPVGLALVALTLSVLCPFLCSLTLQYSFTRLMTGVEYYRYSDVLLPSEIWAAVLLAFLPWAVPHFPVIHKRAWIGVAIQMGVVTVGGWHYIKDGLNDEKEEALQYYCLVTQQQWQKIIQKAEKKHPESPFSMTCLNLALAKQGDLGDRMFEFSQQGTGGLLPAFVRDFTSPLPTAEAYYHMGMVNTTQRYYFEAMEAIPNYQKSARCIKRLAETNIVNGDYKVAEKYLLLLQKTHLYEEWAENAMTYLGNEEKINAHPEWGKLRRMRVEEDFFFNGKEHPEMLGKVFEHNRQNRMASDYRLAYLLLKQDLDAFMTCYETGEYAEAAYIPRSHQEALAYMWLQKHGDFKDIPWKISPSITQGMMEFARVYMSKQKNANELLRRKYRGTYWEYLLNVRKG